METNPILRETKYIYYFVAFWTLVTSMLCLQLVIEFKLNYHFALAESLIYTLLLACFSLVIWFPVKFKNFDDGDTYNIILSHILSAIIISTIWTGSGYFLITQLLVNLGEYRIFLINSLIWKFLFGILFYCLMATFYYFAIYYDRYHEKLLNESELKASVTEAELKSLKFQINPHFIFNALNSISALTMFDSEKAHDMTIKLSNFLRYTLAKNDKQKTKLIDEIDNARLYLDIEKIRFGDKFDLVENINKDALQIEVPSMILQPVFENAVKYGVFESLEKVDIIFTVDFKEEYLKISIENSYDIKGTRKKGEGIGLSNIKTRLKLFYEQDNLIEITDNKSIFKVTIFIPLEKNGQ
jgi:two-component system, LytTR family, sensor kinase